MEEVESPAFADRLVRYVALRPCRTAFIDTRIPGSRAKENFTIIGPGVAENPDQHVHIDIPHGFNIGGARQPPDCINSQHSHETAEVFIVHSGKWAFLLGPNREDGEVVLGPGDTISIPVHVFRGFSNVGENVGFLFAVLGGNDPGQVTWAPYVFEDAEKYGLVLLEDGSLIDTAKGEQIPDGKSVMRPTTDADVAALRRMTAQEFSGCVVRCDELGPLGSALVPGLREAAIIGLANDAERLAAGRIRWPHGFQVRHAAVGSGISTPPHTRAEEEVILMHSGCLSVSLAEGEIDLHPGDVLTIPVGGVRQFANRDDNSAEAYIVRGGDRPVRPTIVVA